MRLSSSDIENQSFDAVIIGAGINGAGIARDAAMRGLRVLLLDKGDLASGTSSWSTRLIHGGLRYLEHGELRLVRESLRERERLLRIAPHLVKPLPMLIPIYEGARRGRLLIKAGMAIYDLLSAGKSLDRHRMLSAAETIKRVPALKAEGLRGAAVYYDAQVEYPERLVVENTLAAHLNGALILTYARVDELIFEDGRARGVRFTDLVGGKSHTARASLIVNATGPWVDEVLAVGGLAAERLVGGTKGSHLVVDDFAGAPLCALYSEASEDGRPFFIIPWNDAYLIGTTDLPFEGDLDSVEASEAEIEYLLRETNRVIPSAKLNRNSIRYTYSGVRPLAYTAARSPSGITRRHFVRDHGPECEGLLSVVGGKLTTYRNLAEQAVELLFKKLGRERRSCETAREPLPGARASVEFARFVSQFKAESGLSEHLAARLLRIYGTRAADLLKIAGADSRLLKPLGQNSEVIGAEIVFSFEEEMAATLADCLWRRTMAGPNAFAGLDVLEAAADTARKYLGWDESRIELEVDAYREYVRRFHPRALRSEAMSSA